MDPAGVFRPHRYDRVLRRRRRRSQIRIRQVCSHQVCHRQKQTWPVRSTHHLPVCSSVRSTIRSSIHRPLRCSVRRSLCCPLRSTVRSTVRSIPLRCRRPIYFFIRIFLRSLPIWLCSFTIWFLLIENFRIDILLLLYTVIRKYINVIKYNFIFEKNNYIHQCTVPN